MDVYGAYQQKLTSAEEAVKAIRSGDWVEYGYSSCMPAAMDKALAARMPELTDVKIRCNNATHRPALFDVADPGLHFTWNTWHVSAVDRKEMENGFVYYIPMRFSEIPKYYRECLEPVDVALLQAAPMDSQGWFNIGPVCSYMSAVCANAKKVIVEVNRNMPVCLGARENMIHIDDVDMIVEGDNIPLDEPAGGSAALSAADKKIAELVVPEIADGSCLQLGIGAVPNAVGKMIAGSDLRDLGVHSELYVDSFVDMAGAGHITGLKKNIDRGRQVYTFAFGTKRLYEYLDNNPECYIAPVDYVNNIGVISQIDNFVSINGAVEVDLFGQVSSESSGTRHISGAGGQQDFVMGAFLSNGGKSFICLSSTYRDKKTGELKSRIRPTLEEGTIVTCTRSNLHWVVTEYGKFNVKGKSTWERAEGLISIAHPAVRDELIDEAEKMHIWRHSNKR
jgi:butyryl-CoA:acetate CoA-transferase